MNRNTGTRRRARRLARTSLVSFALLPFVVSAQQSAPATEAIAPPVEVTAPRLRIITPLPGVVMDERSTTTNVQSVTGEEIRQSRAVSVTDVLNTQVQSVNVNDYTGNPFSQDVNFRGFSASPLIGTPQGISVYLDGVRINEAFGDVINWDLLPLNAVERIDVVPGSNPMYGLNTLGGALAISTRSGFSSPGTEASFLAGSWDRKQWQASVGGNNGMLGGFAAFNFLREDGWRDNSPSALDQFFGRADVRPEFGQITVSMLAAETDLTGNGVVPYEQWEDNPERVYTSPDTTVKDLLQLTLNGRWDVTDAVSLSGLGYFRKLRQDSVSGDFWDEWPAAARRTNPFNPDYPCFDLTTFDYQYPDGAVEIDAPGCPGALPNGVFNNGTSDQDGYGLAAQMSWLTERNQLVVGATLDINDVEFEQTQQLGWIDNDRTVYLAPDDPLADDLVAMRVPIVRNRLKGSSRGHGLFFYNVLTPRPDLNLSFGARYNRTRVKNELASDLPIPLYQFTPQFLANRSDSCRDDSNQAARFQCSEEEFVYESVNPAAGVSWLPRQDVNLFANWSRGSRVPSAIELGCARDPDPDVGKLQGCSIPTALTNDPYLPQVRSTSYELGARGVWRDRYLWNAALFRTDLTDDILFVSLGQKNRGVFDSFDRTRRQGLELGLQQQLGRWRWSAAYTRLEATFEDSATVVNLSNSTASKTQGELNEFDIEPGDTIPGIPEDSLRLGLSFDVTPRFNLGLNVVAQSYVYARGNENNDHEPGGTDSDGSSVSARYDPTITVSPGRAYVGDGKTDAFAVVNLNATYRMSKSFSVFMRVDNLFDEQYVTAAELGLNSFTPSRWGARDAGGFNYNSYDWTHSQFVGPGAPRAVWVGVAFSSRAAPLP